MATCNKLTFDVMDDTWMLADNDPWMTVQDAIKCLNDAFEQLEGNFEVTYDELTLKLTGVEKQELERTQQMTTDFIKRWEAKCKEAENLRLSLKRALHESTRVNDEYHEMEESISKMRQQFGLAIDSSVTEIEELAICNNSLSERIQDLELRLRHADKAMRDNAKSNLELLRKFVTRSHDDDMTVKTLVNNIEKEATKLDRMILMDNFSTSHENEINSNLAEKSQKMVDSISQGLVETLKRELKECRHIVDTQKQQIITMEKEKEEFIENQLIAVHNGDKEIKDLIDYLQKITNREKSDSTDDTTELSKLKRNFKVINNTMRNLNTAADKSYKQHTNITGNILELKEHVGDLNEKIKEYSIKIDETNEERNMFKRKHEQNETQIDILNGEIASLQSRINSLDNERKTLHEENVELKSGSASMEDHFSVLNVENNQLVDQIKTLQNERDKMFAVHEEDILKLNQICQERNQCEDKCENLENAISKLRREYQDQNREVSILSKENEDLKRSLQDGEEDKRKIRSNMKALETINRDLEDQNFELKSDLQKIESENKKMQQSCAENKNNFTELDNKIQILEKLKIDSILKSADQEKEKKKLDDKIKAIEKANEKSQERVDKRTLLLGMYEKMVIKLLHHFKECGRLIKFEVEKHSGSVLCSSMSLEYKEKNEIEASLDETSQFIDTLFQAISSTMMETLKQKQISRDVSNDIRLLLSENGALSSSYGTENDSDFVANVLKLIEYSKSKVIENQHENELQTVCLENKELVCELKKKTQSERRLKFICKLQRKEIRRIKLNIRRPVKKQDQSHQTDESLSNGVVDNVSNPEDKNYLISCLKGLMSRLEKLSYNVVVVMENNVRERLKKDVRHVINDTEEIMNFVTNLHAKPTKFQSSSKLCDGLDERVESIQQQRQYMLDHMSATNNRLEVLLNTLKGRETKSYNDDEADTPKEQLHPMNPFNKERVLKQVRASFKKDEIVMKRAVSILELTKAISVTDVREIGTEKAKDDNQKEVFGLVKTLNENMDSVLREARSNMSLSHPVKVNSLNENDSGMESIAEDVIPKSEFLKVENELKDSLYKAQEKVELLSNFLAERESEIQQRDRIIAQLNQEYEKLKAVAHNKNDINIATRDRMIKEYKAAKERLEQENEFLQHVVKELRHELIVLQQNFRKEEEKQKHLDEFVQELQFSKKALEASLDKMAFELSILQKDREQLMYSFQQMQISKPSPSSVNHQLLHNDLLSYHQPPNPYAYEHNRIPTKYLNNNNLMTPENIQKVQKEKFAYFDMQGNNRMVTNVQNVQQVDMRMPYSNIHDNGHPLHESEKAAYCVHNDLSNSTAVPHSEDDLYLCTSCDDCDSLPSDNEDVISSADSHTTSSSIKVARNISTDEATETIKSRNRPVKYLQKEIDSGLPLISPRTQMKFRRRSLESNESSALHRTPSSSSSNATTTINTTEGRVRGRREQRNYSQELHYDMNQFTPFTPDLSFQRFDPHRLSYDSRRKHIEQFENKQQYYHDGGHVHDEQTKLRSNSTGYFKWDNKRPPREQNFYRNPVPDIDLAVERASLEVEKQYLKEQQKYIQTKQILNSSFLNQNFEKKKKKKFLSFGKK